jgi:thioredoxin reductase (NADPH)
LQELSNLTLNSPSAKNKNMENVIILGSGCAGLTAAIYAARANLNPLIIEGTQPGGQLTTTSEVENFPGFPEGIDGFEMMQRIRQQATRFGTRFKQSIVRSVELSADRKILHTDNESLEARVLIIATGASPKMIGLESEKALFGGGGVTTCATCDGAFYRNMDVVVVGGGDSACEEALFLTRFCSKVTLIHRRDQLRASQIMAKRTLEHPKIEVLWNHQVVEVLGVQNKAVSGVRVRNTIDHSESTLACKGVFVAIGHTPNTSALVGSLPLDENGYVIPVDGSQVRTAIPGVYAAGDCVDHIYRQAITAAGMGCQAAIEAERWLAEQE